MPLLYPEGSNGYSIVKRSMPDALLADPRDSRGMGFLQYLNAFATAPQEIATSTADGIEQGLNALKHWIGPSQAAKDEVDGYGYRSRTTDLFGNEWHPIFDLNDDGAVDMSALAVAFIVTVVMSQIGIPIVRLLSGAAKGIGTGLFRYNVGRRQNKLKEQLEELFSRISEGNVTLSDKVDRMVSETTSNTVDIEDLVTKIANALRFNNTGYLA
jgi:hypothetical protein